jgi:hypothetical protein
MIMITTTIRIHIPTNFNKTEKKKMENRNGRPEYHFVYIKNLK